MLTTKRLAPTWRAQLCCTRGYADKPVSPNQGILDMLARHRQLERDKSDYSRYKLTAFTKAIKSIEELEYPITSLSDTSQLPRLGLGVRGRILAYLNNETWDAELHGKVAGHDVADDALRIFTTKVRGIKAPTARKLVKAGCTSVEQLIQPQFLKLVPSIVRTDIQFQAHWDKKVTRTEAERVQIFISQSLQDYEVHLVGNHRRMIDESDSIDVVLVHPSLTDSPYPMWKKESALITGGPRAELQELSELLEDRGLIAGCIGMGTCARGPWHWEGWIRLPEVREGGGFESVISRREGCDSKTGEFRLMRFAIVGKHALGSALLTYTGDDEYTKVLDKQARKMCMYLNGEALWKWVFPTPDPEDEPTRALPIRGAEGHFEPLPSHTEEVVLEQLGQQWVPPEKRNFAFLKLNAKETRGRKSDPTKVKKPVLKPRRLRKPKDPPTPPPQYTDEQLKRVVADPDS